MEDLMQWAAEVEQAAADVYRAGARFFAADVPFAEFLEQLAGEEEWHASLLRAAGEGRSEDFSILPDTDTQQRVQDLFRRGGERLASGGMRRDEMLQLIAAAEFSEWNDYFLYALGVLKLSGEEFRLAVLEIERHKAQILAYFNSQIDGAPCLELLRGLPAVTHKRILVVEQRPGLAHLLRSALAPIGEVEVVTTGPEGVARVERRAFDVILSDIDMADMDSFDFYRQVVRFDPAFSARMLFYSGGRQALSGVAAAGIPTEQQLQQPLFLSHICRAVAGVASGGVERQMH